MPTYAHYQHAKSANAFPRHDQIGACLTCKWWDTTEHRDESLVGRVALCVQEELKPFALLVSGGSACNRWEEKANKEPEAHAYASRDEEDKAVQKEKARLAGEPSPKPAQG